MIIEGIPEKYSIDYCGLAKILLPDEKAIVSSPICKHYQVSLEDRNK